MPSRRRRIPFADDTKECHVSTTADFGPGVGEVFGPSHREGGPELVQLLSPEGEVLTLLGGETTAG